VIPVSNSPLVSFTKISPNKNSPRNHEIDTVTIHCYVGQVTVERMGEGFASPYSETSANYGIGKDGRIGMYVEEKDRSWCSSNRDNDHRAITIEVASGTKHPYEVTDEAYKSLIDLLVDICRRNNIKELKWKADKKLIGKPEEQNMTVHRWFANKDCPGEYLYSRHGQIAEEVNARLNSTENKFGPNFEKPNPKYIWDFLIGKGLNAFAVAGIMGNLASESSFRACNLQGTYERKLDMTDEEYTLAVDDGTYNNFVHDSAGYGIAQWTYYTRKQALLDYAKAVNASIGNLDMQLEFLWKELQTYKAVMKQLESAKTVAEASNAIMLGYEKPANQSESNQNARAANGQTYYDLYAPKKTAASEYTKVEFIKDVQEAIGAKVDGIAGSETLSKTVTVSAKVNRDHAVVKPIQKRLAALGYSEVGAADGIAGPKFTSAVAHFQVDKCKVVDGEITAGKTTWRKLLGMS
jgi:hypothetical protein